MAKQILLDFRVINNEQKKADASLSSIKVQRDIEVNDEITARELIVGLNIAYGLGIDILNDETCFLRSENPIQLIKGNRKLYEFGLHNGSIVYHMN